MLAIFKRSIDNFSDDDFLKNLIFLKNNWFSTKVLKFDEDHFAREDDSRLCILRKFDSCSEIYSFGCKLCSCVFIFSHAAASAVHLEKPQQLLQFTWKNAAAYAMLCTALLTDQTHLLDSLPRGNLVDGLPRAASIMFWLLEFGSERLNQR